MIEETPPLQFAPSIERPPRDVARRFAGVPTSFVADALGGSGALDWRVKPIVGTTVCGVALTCDCGPNDNLALIAALRESEPGDVIVAATGGFTGAAVTGDVLLGIARNRGVVGFVTDGLVRDLADLAALGLPVFAMGLTPNSPGRRGPGTVGVPVVCGGQTVASGDIVVGDGDGVVVVPKARIAETLDALERVKAAEAEMNARVRGGARDVSIADAARRSPGKGEDQNSGDAGV